MANLRASVRRSVSVNSVICTFHFVVKLGPHFMHLLCHRMMYRKSIGLGNKANYTKFFNNVFSADISCKCSYCRVCTVALVHV